MRQIVDGLLILRRIVACSLVEVVARIIPTHIRRQPKHYLIYLPNDTRELEQAVGR